MPTTIRATIDESTPSTTRRPRSTPFSTVYTLRPPLLEQSSVGPTTIQETRYEPGLSVSIGDLFSSRVQIELLWVVLGQFVATLGSLAALRLFTTVLTPHVYGDVALAM